jgi:hypothetical protein
MTYRQSAIARSETLEKLAGDTRAARRAGVVPTEARQLPPEAAIEKLELAVDIRDDRGAFGLTATILWLVLSIGASTILKSREPTSFGAITFVLIMFMFASLATFGWWISAAAATQRRATAIADALAWATSQPFDVDGFREWLVSDVPMLTIKLRAGIDPAMMADALATIDRAITTEVIDETTIEITIPPRQMTESGRYSHRSTKFGNLPLLKTVFERCVLPMHAEVGIVRIGMGGTLERRS